MSMNINDSNVSPNFTPTQETTTTQGVDSGSTTTTQKGLSGKSTLSQSDIAALVAAYIASNPSLDPPKSSAQYIAVDGVNPESISAMYSKSYREAVQSILDNMTQSIEEEKKRRKELEDSPEYKAEQDESSQLRQHQKRESDPKLQEDAAAGNPLFQIMLTRLTPEQLNQLDNSIQPLAASGLSEFLTPASIAIGSTMTGTVITASQVPNMVEPTQVVFEEMMQKAQNALATTNINVGALGLIGSLFLMPLSAATTTQSVEAAAKKNGADGEKNIDFYKKFAKNLLNLLDPKINPTFNNRLEKALGKDGAAALKTIMLSMALALIYKKEIGDWKVSAQEFRDGMLGGEIKFTDVRKDVIIALRQQLNSLPENVRAKLIDAIAEYLESNPKVAEMEKPMAAARGVLARANRGETQA